MFHRYSIVLALWLLSVCMALAAAPSSNAAQHRDPANQDTAIKPSFDCTTAKSKVKLLICGDADLAALDMQEDQLLRRARAKAVQPDAVNAEQDLWIAQRDGCSNSACLSRAYRQRIQQLHAWTN
jgi:uncharacterized protein